MLDRLRDVEARYEELGRMLGDPATLADYQRLAPLSKERAGLEELVQVAREYRRCSEQLAEARLMQQEESDAELRALAAEESEMLQAGMAELEARLRLLLLPKDPRDERNVIMEIRAGAGGEEAGSSPRTSSACTASTPRTGAGRWTCWARTSPAWAGCAA